MSTLKYVKATIVQSNTLTLLPGLDRTPVNREIDCERLKIGVVEYLVPFSTNGILESYTHRIIDIAHETPPADAIRTLHLKDTQTGENIWIAITNIQDEADFADFCNQCCGSSNDYSFSGTFPDPVQEEVGCPTTTGTPTYTYRVGVPANPFSANITLSDFSYNNGTPPSVAITAGGYASLAALVTWLNTNLGALGTWSNDSGKLKLVSTVVTSVDMDIELVPKSYCMPLPSVAFTATTLVVKDAANADFSITIPPLTVSRANNAGVLAALKTHLAGTSIISTTNIQYTGLQKPVKLTDGTTNAIFAAGVC